MEEIKVGEYIRTKNGTINQIKAITPYYENNELILNECYVDAEDFKEWKVYQLNSIIKKHSLNIIDLIEEGDYVNGKMIEYVATIELEGNPCDKVAIYDEKAIHLGDFRAGGFRNDEIKDIFTHEQFESMKYVVGGREEC